MKIGQIPSPNLSGSSESLSQKILSQNSNFDFKKMMESLQGKTDLGFDNSLLQIDKIQKSLQSSGVLDLRKILQYQIQINQLNLRVELVSKAAESAAALGRKLQNAQ